MASWKKVIVSGSDAELNALSLSGLSNQGSEATAVMINGSGVVGTRELQANAFTSTTIGTTTNALTVDDATIKLNTGTTFNGSAARTISIKDGGVDADALAAGVAGNGLTGGGGSALAVGAGTGIDVAANEISVDVSDFMATGSANRVITATGTDAMAAQAGLTYDGAQLNVTGNISSSGAIMVDAGSGFKLNDGGTTRFAVTNGTGGEIAFGFENDTPIKIGRTNNPINMLGNVTASGNIFTENTIIAGTKFSGNLVGNVTGDVTGDLTGNADSATLATSITATANNTANETVYLTFVDGATGTQGIETDTGLSYNPNTGLLTTTAAVLSGQIQASTLKATNNSILQSAVASNISSSGYISASVFVGDGSSLTGVTADSLAGSLTDGNGIADFTFDGSTGASVALDLDGSTLSVGSSGVKIANAGVTATQLATSVAGDGLSGGGGTALSVDYGSSANDAVEGNTTISLTGTANEVQIIGTTAQALGGGPSYTIGLPADVTISDDLTVGGDLIVSGDVVSLNAANLNVEDKFILLNSGSTSGDGGVIVQTGANGIGTSVFYDDSIKRWGLTIQDGTAWNATSTTANYHINAVSQSAAAPTGNPYGFGTDAASRRGLMVIDTSTEDIYIYS